MVMLASSQEWSVLKTARCTTCSSTSSGRRGQSLLLPPQPPEHQQPPQRHLQLLVSPQPYTNVDFTSASNVSITLLFTPLAMDEDEELERAMLSLSPSKFNTETSQWLCYNYPKPGTGLSIYSCICYNLVTCAFRATSSCLQDWGGVSAHRFLLSRHSCFPSPPSKIWPCSGVFWCLCYFVLPLT